MLNYSAIETKIEIAFDTKDSVFLDASDFAFETDPLSIQSMPVSKLELDLNGHPVIMRSRQPINLTLSLIPGCTGDNSLQDSIYVNRCYGDEVTVNRMTVTYPTSTRYVFINGVISSGIPGVGLSGDGKIRNGGIYNLSFAKFERHVTASVNEYTDNKFQTEGKSKKQPTGDKSKKTTTNKPKKVISGKCGWGIQF